MKHLIVIYLFTLNFNLFGQEVKTVKKEEKRPSSLIGTYSKDKDHYSALLIEGNLGLSSSWSLNASFFQSDSGTASLLNEKLITKEEHIGVDWNINKYWGTAFGLSARQEPYETVSQGGNLSIRTELNQWWKAKRKTSLTLKGEFVKIAQDLQVQGKILKVSVYKYLEQKNLNITLNQEFLDFLNISFSHSTYRYSEEVSNLDLYILSKKISMGAGTFSYGYPDASNTLEILLYPYDWLELRLLGSETKSAGSSSVTKTASLGASLFWNNYQLDLEYAHSDYGNSSQLQASNQSISSIGLGYNW